MSKTVNLCQGNLKFTCNTFFCGIQSEHLLESSETSKMSVI